MRGLKLNVFGRVGVVGGTKYANKLNKKTKTLSQPFSFETMRCLL